jgi:tRNA U55 pseudouridine synthase TruB
MRVQVGHAGTLDPMATGLLIICTGRATKRINAFVAMRKEYSGTLRLGQATPSYDAACDVCEELPWEHITGAGMLAACLHARPWTAVNFLTCIDGTALKAAAASLSRDVACAAYTRGICSNTAHGLDGEASSAAPRADENLEAAKAAFVGNIQQQPPMYSAVSIGGERLYKAARRGETVERPARPVTVHSFRLAPRGAAGGREVHFRVACSKGTYIRALAHDLVRALLCAWSQNG